MPLTSCYAPCRANRIASSKSSSPMTAPAQPRLALCASGLRGRRSRSSMCGTRIAAFGADIRNCGIHASTGAYLLFLDGDCIARRNFVAAHRRFAEPGWFVTGTRILLSGNLTDRILHHGLEPESWGLARWAVERSRRQLNRFAPLLDLKLGGMRKLSARRWRGARGSNMAFWRTDLENVDGFDTSFSGWGREDSDLFIRLIRAGVHRKDGRFATGVLHLWHPSSEERRV